MPACAVKLRFSPFSKLQIFPCHNLALEFPHINVKMIFVHILKHWIFVADRCYPMPYIKNAEPVTLNATCDHPVNNDCVEY